MVFISDKFEIHHLFILGFEGVCCILTQEMLSEDLILPNE